MENGKMTPGSRFGFAIFCLGLFMGGAYSADTLNYDTAWTFVYDGGKTASGDVIYDNFRDVKTLPSGETICVGETRDTSFLQNILLVKLDKTGKLVRKKLLAYNQGVGGASLLVSKNGDYIVGGKRSGSPLLVRLDTSFNIKTSTWYYDSVSRKEILARSAVINSMVETQNGRIMASAGDMFPDNNGLALNNYASFLEFDSTGAVKPHHEWLNTTGYELAGWSLTPGETGGYMLGGKQSVFGLDSTGGLVSQSQYTFSLPGVGSVTNNVTRVRRLRNGTVMVAGQSYEEDCWTKYQRLYFDAWWSPLSPTGKDDFRYVAGVSGANDVIYDFTQLASGNIVFVGKKQSFDQVGGIWAIVTDSLGKNILWQKQVRIPYLVADGSALMPWSVSASPDSGFTVVGLYGLNDSLGGNNAFAAHFIGKPVPNSIVRTRLPKVRNHGRIFSFEAKGATDAELRLFTPQGRLAARYSQHVVEAGPAEFRIDTSRLKAGLYFWQLHAGDIVGRGATTVAD